MSSETSTTTTTTPPNTTTTDALGWTSANWDELIDVVHEETRRSNTAQKILPLHGPLPDAMNVPSDTTVENGDLRIIEGDSTVLNEVSVQLAMTKTQVQQIQDMSTASTLVTRAANLVATGQDHIIFQGTLQNLPQALRNLIQVRNGDNVDNLLGLNEPQIEEIPVRPILRRRNLRRYNESTVAAVTDGISRLQVDGHYGPYALVLHTGIYADVHNPLPDTLIMPADRIKPLLDKGIIYGTSALPPQYGVLLSLGGNTMDVSIGIDATPEYLSLDNEGMYRFRVFSRSALRLKNPRAVKRLRFN